MIQSLIALLGRVLAGQKHTPESARQVRPGLESLDERVLPSTLPNLVGGSFNLGGGRSLHFTSEGNPNASYTGFTGTFQDSAHNVSTNVSGTLSLQAVGSGGYRDFHLAYSGRTDLMPGSVYSGVIGSGDIATFDYTGGSLAPYSYYSGQDYDYFVFNVGFIHNSTSANNSDFTFINVPTAIDPGTALVGATR